jgi:hypothetical protein
MYEPDFAPPPGLERSLWRSLVINLADRFAPERLAPLQLTSHPVEVELASDIIEVPWYRTIFRNISDVVSPERLPPLNLTSHPIDVGELPGDELSHGWWNSLLQELRDRLAPERLPALSLTSQPVPEFGADAHLQILDWSVLIAGPKVYLPDQPRSETVRLLVQSVVSPPMAQENPEAPSLLLVRSQLVRDIGRTTFRRRIWISLAVAEAGFLFFAIFKLQ